MSNLQAWVDFISDNKVTGWAFDPSDPKSRQQIEVYKDSQILGIVEANEYRENLKKRGKGDGKYQFTYKVPTTENVRKLVFKVKGSQDAIRIAGSQARPREDRFRHSFVYGRPNIETAISISQSKKSLEVSKRILAAYREFFVNSRDDMKYEAMWESITTQYHRKLVDLILENDAKELSEYLSNMNRTAVVHGVSQGAKLLETIEANEKIRSLVEDEYWDRFVSVAELLGALNFEDPVKLGRWGENLYFSPNEIKEKIEKVIGFGISLPNPSAGLFGILLGKTVFDARMIEAIYTGFRTARLSRQFNTSVVEIGAGMGWSAYFATKSGVNAYTIFDLPVMNVLQAYNLCCTLDDDEVIIGNEAAPRESKARVRVLDASRFEATQFNDGQLFFNQDSFPEIGQRNVGRYLDKIASVKSARLLSINQECEGRSGSNERQLVVKHEVERNGGFIQEFRAAYWPRPGYTEEQFFVKR